MLIAIIPRSSICCNCRLRDPRRAHILDSQWLRIAVQF
jgi:hypothetical protein